MERFYRGCQQNTVVYRIFYAEISDMPVYTRDLFSSANNTIKQPESIFCLVSL
jgi:hypothetical protein